jgi:hypothetical protein
MSLKYYSTFGKGCALNDINVVTIKNTPFEHSILPYVVGDEKKCFSCTFGDFYGLLFV